MSSQTQSFSSDGARLTTVKPRNIHPRSMSGFVTVKQESFRVEEELTTGRNHIAERNRSLLSYSGGEEDEIGRGHILAQDQGPFTIGRQRRRRALSQANCGGTVRIATEHGIIAAACLACLNEQHELSVFGYVDGNGPILPAQVAFLILPWRQADCASAQGVTRNQCPSPTTGVVQGESAGSAEQFPALAGQTDAAQGSAEASPLRRSPNVRSSRTSSLSGQPR